MDRPSRMKGSQTADGITGRVTLVIDAQRQEFYLASYNLQPGKLRVIEPLRLATAAEAREQSKAGGLLLGPEVNRWFPEGRVLIPNAAAVAGLAVGRTDFTAGEELDPIYLRETSFVKAAPTRVPP